MEKIKLWVDFNNVKTADELTNKANIKLTVEGYTKIVDIVSQIDLKSGYDLEIEDEGEYCISIECEDFMFKENFEISEATTQIEIVVE